MLSFKAIYDGKELKFKDKIKITTPHEVIVTFLDEPDKNICFVECGAFDFLNDPEQDIYSDDDLKVKY
jgi:hypothetical protein